MKYRAIITLEFDAFDQPALAGRTREIRDWVRAFEERFGPATFAVKERRPRRAPRVRAPSEVWTGR